MREMQEETGIVVRPREVVLVFDRIQREGAVRRYHYVIIDYLCDYVSGDLRAGSDADERRAGGAWTRSAATIFPPRPWTWSLDVFRRAV